jgi:hypothetical protein
MRLLSALVTLTALAVLGGWLIGTVLILQVQQLHYQADATHGRVLALERRFDECCMCRESLLDLPALPAIPSDRFVHLSTEGVHAMPYKGHVMKETNNHPQGRSGSKVMTKKGPAFGGGGAKSNTSMDHALGRKPAGKMGK